MAQTYRIEIFDAHQNKTVRSHDVVSADATGQVATRFAEAIADEIEIRVHAIEAGNLRTIAVLRPAQTLTLEAQRP